MAHSQILGVVVAKAVPGSSVIWMGVAILVAVYAGWLSSQVDAANERAADAREREQTLVQQLQQMAAGVAEQSRARGADQAGDQELAVALLRRPDLIPFEGEVGGTFYFLEDSLQVLSDRYLYVACEDGHVMCHLLVAYQRSDDGIEFEVIDAYRR